MAFPFHDSPDTAAITCRHILDEGMTILYVSHDEDDGMWQFLCGGENSLDDARLVSLQTIYEHDNRVSTLADMPCGYCAERKNAQAEWLIRFNGGD